MLEHETSYYHFLVIPFFKKMIISCFLVVLFSFGFSFLFNSLDFTVFVQMVAGIAWVFPAKNTVFISE